MAAIAPWSRRVGREFNGIFHIIYNRPRHRGNDSQRASTVLGDIGV